MKPQQDKAQGMWGQNKERVTKQNVSHSVAVHSNGWIILTFLQTLPLQQHNGLHPCRVFFVDAVISQGSWDSTGVNANTHLLMPAHMLD